MARPRIGHNQPNTVSVDTLTSAEKDRLKKLIQELDGSMTRVSAEKTLQKEAIDAFFNDIAQVDKKLIRKMARIHYNSNYDDEVDNFKSFENSYDSLFAPKDKDV